MAEPGRSGRRDSDGHDDWHRRLHRQSPAITAVLAADGTVVYVNPAVERILGYRPEEVTGTSTDEYVHPADWSAVSDTIRGIRSDPDDVRTIEVRVRRAEESWSRLTLTLRSRLEDDVIEGILVTGRPSTSHGEPKADPIATKERMKLALEGANLGVWDWDMVTDEVDRDELLTEMLGYTPAEMGDHLVDWAELVHPAGKQRHDEALAEHVANRTPYYESEYRLKTKSGEWKWVRTMGKVVERDDDGSPLRAVGIHQDIDDRKRAQLALREEREMFTQGPAVVFKWADEAGWPVEYVSENVEDVFGYAPMELHSEGVVFADLVHDADLDGLVQDVSEQRSGEGNRINPDPYRIITAEGDVRWVLEHTKKIQDGSSDGYLLGYLVDITERKRRERELAERERKYRKLFEDTRDALMVLDRDGFIDCNERTLELFGCESVDSFVEYSPWDLSPPTQSDGTSSREAALGYIERAFQEGEAFFEWTHQRADGTEFPAEVKLSRFEYEGEPALHALVRDITERKVYERRLEEQRDNLDVLNQMLRHDVRNDLQLVTAYAELVAEQCNGEIEEHIGTLLASAEHAVELTETAGEMADVMLSADERLENVDLRPVLDGALEEVRSAYPDAVVTVESSVPSVTVQAGSMLGSVFRNLLKNAVQHNDKAVPEVTVSVTVDEAVVVRIADNGPGIPSDRRDAIFGKGETSLESSGTGLGLYLVETLVDSYRGAVRIEPNEPDGVVFAVELSRVE